LGASRNWQGRLARIPAISSILHDAGTNMAIQKGEDGKFYEFVLVECGVAR
jgi:hypothetical protein